MLANSTVDVQAVDPSNCDVARSAARGCRACRPTTRTRRTTSVATVGVDATQRHRGRAGPGDDVGVDRPRCRVAHDDGLPTRRCCHRRRRCSRTSPFRSCWRTRPSTCTGSTRRTVAHAARRRDGSPSVPPDGLDADERQELAVRVDAAEHNGRRTGRGDEVDVESRRTGVADDDCCGLVAVDAVGDGVAERARSARVGELDRSPCTRSTRRRGGRSSAATWCRACRPTG